MANRFARNVLPKNHDSTDFQYKGRPAREQLDIDKTTGIVDMLNISITVEANNSEYAPDAGNKYYHCGVVQSTIDSSWWAYFEWGSAAYPDPSWDDGVFREEEDCGFQFVQCANESEARAEFIKKVEEKHTKRLESIRLGQSTIWRPKQTRSKKKVSGYIIQDLATRMRGLPHAASIVTHTLSTKKTSRRKGRHSQHQAVVDLALDLTQGTQHYSQQLFTSTGIIPSLDTIDLVRDEFLPQVYRYLSAAPAEPTRPSNKTQAQFKRSKAYKDYVKAHNSFQSSTDFRELSELSEYIAALIPRDIPKDSDKADRIEAVLLRDSTMAKQLEQDLVTFETTLQQDIHRIQNLNQIDPDQLLNAHLEWIAPQSKHGKWLSRTLQGMTNNRHFRRNIEVVNAFEVFRDDRDSEFVRTMKRVAKSRSRYSLQARLQPSERIDTDVYGTHAENANLFIGIHGTRAINVQPIVSSNLRLPTQLKGVHITGAAFGHGIYFATDWKKSYGYTGEADALYGSGGTISGRGFFLLLCDVVMGEAHQAKGAHPWVASPKNTDSIAVYPEFSTVRNDEHVVFTQSHQRIRYIIEARLK